MSSVQAHFRRSESDSAEAARMALNPSRSHWELVVRFYSALHLTQAYLMTKNARFHAKRHDERNEAIKKSPELNHKFRSAYNRLRDVSEQVRYDPGFLAAANHFADAQVDAGTVSSFVSERVKRWLEPNP